MSSGLLTGPVARSLASVAFAPATCSTSFCVSWRAPIRMSTRLSLLFDINFSFQPSEPFSKRRETQCRKTEHGSTKTIEQKSALNWFQSGTPPKLFKVRGSCKKSEPRIFANEHESKTQMGFACFALIRGCFLFYL